MQRLDEFLTTVCRDVDQRLDELIPSASTRPRRLHEAIRWSLFAGGKRFRPALLIAVGETLGATRDRLLTSAAAIEMIHTYSLIHDDLPSMDDDDLRRGRATCHVQFDEATAILAGDVLQTLAFKAIADDVVLEPDVRIGLILTISSAAGTPVGMVSGQQLDIEAEGRDASVDEILAIHSQKTGAMITAAAVSGALIAGTKSSEVESIQSYAQGLGLLFQITDDLLDITQETAVLGKTAGKDVSSRKATFPSVLGIERSREMAAELRSESGEALRRIDRDTELLNALLEYVVARSR